MKQDEVMRALNACYDSVVSPETWGDSLHQLARSIDATATMFYPKDVNSAATEVPASRDYQDFLAHYVEQGWYEGHYRAERGWPLLETRSVAVVVEHDLATDEERKQLRHYHDLYLRWGFVGFAAVGFKVDNKPWCVPFLRSKSQGFFTHQEAESLSGLGEHFSRMVRLSERFVHARASTGLAAFDRIDRAAALLDGNGRVMELNSKAEALLGRSRDALYIRDGVLRAVHSDSNRRLQSIVAAGTSSLAAHFPVRESSPIYIVRPMGRPLVAEVVSIRDLVTLISHRAYAILLISDPAEPHLTRTDDWGRTFGMTPAEVLLCEKMLNGLSLSEASDELGIAIGTARQRLKSILQKTDTHRQGELLLLLSKL